MNKQLIDAVLTQVTIDVKAGDLTAIEELIKDLPEEKLRWFLPESHGE